MDVSDFYKVFDILGKDQSRVPSSSGGASFPNIGPIDITPGIAKTFGGFTPGAEDLTKNPQSGIYEAMGTETGTPANSIEDQTQSAGGGGWMDIAEGWFIRAVIIILGFIFVAVGLSMFKQNVIAK